MKGLKIIEILPNGIRFNKDISILSYHDQECCEKHYLHTGDLDIKEFKKLNFDLSTDKWFRRVPGFGIRLIPTNGQPIPIPGYADSNGNYSDRLDLHVLEGNVVIKSYNITECQKNI